jgi:amino-acid N-acetyltransferase
MTPARDVLTGEVTIRRAAPQDVPQIAALVAEWSAEELLLPRTAADVALALDGYVVAVDGRGCVLACGALREYSPSLAELTSLAVVRAAHGRGLGRLVVAQVEQLAMQRGHAGLFAHTLEPGFFRAIGYEEVDRARFPEKQARAHTLCFARTLAPQPDSLAAAA